MRRLASLLCLLALAASSTACLDSAETYDVKVDWTTTNPPPGIGTARVTYQAETIETHGYTGTARVIGEAQTPDIEICVELGTYAVADDESTYCEFFADCEPAPEFIAMTDRQCARVRVDQHTVAFSF
jgi:hypothetical protein